MLRIFIIFFLCIISSNVYALTLKSGGTLKSSGTASASEQTSATKLNTELVTRKREASSLSDEELCLSLTKLDLPSTFYEHQKRGLNCLAIQNPQESWTMVTREKAFKHLRNYQKKYNVVTPQYSFKNIAQSFGSVKKTAELYQLLNPNFQDLYFNKGIETGKISDRMQFCLDWFGNVNYVAENQSKNLDGSVSWKDDTLRDGFVICQGSFNAIYLRALLDANVKAQLEDMLLSWINNDRLRRDMERPDRFMQVYIFNKATIAIEMFADDFDWSDEQNKKLADWMERRAIELFPSDASPLSGKCPTNYKSDSFNSFEACKNGGILRAQALLRVGILNADKEFIDMAFIAFHRYMSGIRKDGSNIGDARRGCTAADYNIWASQFMSDFLYQWDRISDPLWEKTFNNNVTPSKAVEYSLSLYGDFESVNKHTVASQWQGCGDDQINKTQQATTQYGESWYPRISFAPYFAHKDTLLEALFDYDRLTEGAYTAQSGANYEISLLAKNPVIQSEVKVKIQDRLLAKISATVPEAIKRLGLSRNISGAYIKLDPSSINLEGPSLKDYRPPKQAGHSARYRVKFETLQDVDLKLDRQTITFWKSSEELLIGIWLEDLIENNYALKADWKSVYDKCGDIVEDSEFYYLEIPIKTNWPELNDQFECIAENVNSPKIVQMIGLLTYAASNTDLDSLQ